MRWAVSRWSSRCGGASGDGHLGVAVGPPAGVCACFGWLALAAPRPTASDGALGEAGSTAEVRGAANRLRRLAGLAEAVERAVGEGRGLSADEVARLPGEDGRT